MTKADAVALFGRDATQADLGRALGMTRQAISNWPPRLRRDQVDRVLGAALRLRRPIPSALLAAVRRGAR